jgi:hypothetical protein
MIENDLFPNESTKIHSFRVICFFKPLHQGDMGKDETYFHWQVSKQKTG